MGFKNAYNTNKYPKRLWAVVGESGDGKSTFCGRMKQEQAVIDADGKYDTTVFMQGITGAYPVVDNPYDARDVGKIRDNLRKKMPGSGINTIIVDSVTPIIKRIVTDAMSGKQYNKVTDFKEKAQAMRTLIDVVTEWGTDVIFVYHYETSFNTKGDEVQSPSISNVELARLQKHINAKLEIVKQGEKRGIKVVWSSAGRSGETLWDETGSWEGMPERIEAYLYDNLTDEEIKNAQVQVTDVSSAILYGMKSGAFKDEVHAQNSYNKLKKELLVEFGAELDADTMFGRWIEKVDAKAKEDEKDGQ